MRLFVALWPSGDVVRTLEGLPRPDPEVRWTTPAQWHLTLRFLGELPDDALDAVRSSLVPVTARRPRDVVLGPRTVRLGRGRLIVPAAGADDLAAAVAAATAAHAPPERRPFRGHLTLARARGRRPVPTRLAGTPVTASWRASEVALVRSHLDAGGARYETVHTIALARTPGSDVLG